MITIDQLLESVDLDFEPRFVTKDEWGAVLIWSRKPTLQEKYGAWVLKNSLAHEFVEFNCLKLAEFDGKDWTECIYEVPRKETVVRVREYGWIGKKCVFWDKYRDIPYYGILGAVNDNRDTPYWCIGLNRWFMQCELDVDKIKPITLPALVDEQIEDPSSRDAWIHIIVGKIAELVDAVNELKGAKNE